MKMTTVLLNNSYMKNLQLTFSEELSILVDSNSSPTHSVKPGFSPGFLTQYSSESVLAWSPRTFTLLNPMAISQSSSYMTCQLSRRRHRRSLSPSWNTLFTWLPALHITTFKGFFSSSVFEVLNLSNHWTWKAQSSILVPLDQIS